MTSTKLSPGFAVAEILGGYPFDRESLLCFVRYYASAAETNSGCEVDVEATLDLLDARFQAIYTELREWPSLDELNASIELLKEQGQFPDASDPKNLPEIRKITEEITRNYNRSNNS